MRILAPALLSIIIVACGESPSANAIADDDTVNAMFPTEAPPVGVTEGPPAAGPSVAPPVALAGLPERFQGVFDQNRAACADPSSVYRLTVSEDELRFYESVGQVRGIAPSGDGGLNVTAEYQGEGERWEERLVLTLSADDDQLTVTRNGQSMERVRCR